MKKLLIKCCLLLSLVPCFNSCTSLLDAAKEGDVATVQRFISEGTNVNQANERGATPLHWAAHKGHTEVVRLLIAAGADVNKENPLSWAASGGQIETAALLIAAGADVNKADKYGNTPLHWAAMGGWGESQSHLDVATLLIAAGADVNKADNDGWTPLHEAAFNGRAKIAGLLIIAGADALKVDYKGRTACSLAMVSKQFYTKDFIEYVYLRENPRGDVSKLIQP